MSAGEGYPRAREDGLVTEAIGDDLLVYDTETSRAHSLNASAAAVFQACDGTRSVGQIAERTGLEADAVGLALADLDKSGLLDGYARPGEVVSRRAVIRRLAVAGAGIGVAVPVIRSITAPTPALAVSTSHKVGQPCTPGSNSGCASGSRCNPTPGPQQNTCFRDYLASCSDPSSCYASSFNASACNNGLCGSCSHNSQCRTGFTCSNQGHGSYCYTE